MNEYTETLSKTGDQVLQTLEKGFDAVEGAVGTVAGTVANYMPDLPELPIADRLPEPRELVETYFAFAAKLLELQKSFALDLLKALEPITGKQAMDPKNNGTKAAAK